MSWWRDLTDSVLGRREQPQPLPDLPRPPTSAQLLDSVDAVEKQVAGTVPPAVAHRVARVVQIVRDTVPGLDNLGAGSTLAH
jgi:hypothetical protein